MIRNHSIISISMFRPSGIGTLMTSLKALSSRPRSISLLWTLISYLSQVAVPSPSGDFLVVTFNLLVGKGIGPLMLTPVLSEISLMYEHTSLILLISMLANLILAFCILLGIDFLAA